MSKTASAAVEPIDIDNEVDIDGIDWEQEGRDVNRLFTDWVDADVEVLSCTLSAPVLVTVTEASRYFLRSSVKVSTPHHQTLCLCLSTAIHPRMRH
jgi:hypothetical protein